MASLLFVVVMVGCVYAVSADEAWADGSCEVEEDPINYVFGFGYSALPYEYINDDGELAGIGYDITRSVCKLMNKKCHYSVYYDYTVAWDEQGKSLSLNNRWHDALVTWLPTSKKMSAYSFFGEYAKEQPPYLFVKDNSEMTTVQDVKDNADFYGFRAGFTVDDSCLEKHLGMSLSGKAKFYGSTEDMLEALNDGDIDVIFIGEKKLEPSDPVKRIGEPMLCAKAGVSIMTRKDSLEKFAWYDVGLAKLRANGEYDWLCNINSAVVDPGCF